MRDGAKWIKCLRPEFQFNKSIHTVQGLDKFHFKQALRHIALNIDLENIITDYMHKNKKKAFIECCDILKKIFSHRSGTIENNKKIDNTITNLI